MPPPLVGDRYLTRGGILTKGGILRWNAPDSHENGGACGGSGKGRWVGLTQAFTHNLGLTHTPIVASYLFVQLSWILFFL